MDFGISHDRSEETPEAKARWFQSLSLAQRMDLFCEFTEMILSINPRMMELKDAKSVTGRVLVLAKTQS